MVIAPLHIGLVGCGSRGLSILERLLSISAERPGHPVKVDIFDPHVFGSGVHWPDQPDYLLLNTVAGQLGVYPDTAALGGLPEARERSGPDFLTWCRQQDVRVDPATGAVAETGRAVEAHDFLPRRLLGAYLADAFQALLATVPRWVTVHLHQEQVVGVDAGDEGGYALTTASGASVRVEHLVLTVGHTGRVRRPEAGRVSDVYPLPGTLDAVQPGEAVVVEGLGLGAMDTLAALTAGRGGRYQRMADGSHSYQPSGREPIIYIQSRDGLPFRGRPDGLTQAARHPAIFLTSARIQALRDNTPGRRLDFDAQVLPLMLLEMRAAAVAVLHARSDAARHLEILEQLRLAALQGQPDTAAAEALLRHFEAAAGATDVQALIRHALPAGVSARNYHAWMYQTIEADLQEARAGRSASAVKAAIEVWRDLRDRLREAVDFEGLTEGSHGEFYGRWHKAINRLVAGPQKERHADLLALSDAGLLTFLAPGASPAATSVQRIAAYVPGSGISDSDNAAVRDLARLGLVRPRSAQAAIDGIDVDAACHPRSTQGTPVSDIWVLGPLVEGSCYYNHYVTSAGAASRLFMDAHKAAKAILQVGTHP